MDDSTRESLTRLLGLIAQFFIPAALIVWAIHSFPYYQVGAFIRRQAPMPTNTKPGNFKVDGVDRATKMDATEYIQASSPDNARAKAELSGMIVTRVERV